MSVAGVVTTLAVVVVLATLLMASPIGLTMRSIFDDEDAAAAAGVATRRVKIASVVVSAAVVGVAGGLLAKFCRYVAPDESLGILVSFAIALYTLIGGTHSILGALAGAFAVAYPARAAPSGRRHLAWVPAALDFLAAWRFVVYGVLVMVLMAVLPEGLVTRRMALRLTAPARVVVRRIMLRNEPVGPPGPEVDRPEPGGTLLEIGEVSHRFGGVQALDDVTFSVAAGEILALVGANGAGKSTLIDVVAGRRRCQQGSIRLGGEELTGLRPEARVHAGVARTFQSVRMFGHLTVEEVVRLGRRAARRRRPPGVDELLALVDLEGRREHLPGSLTLAEQRRLEVARAVASAPAIVLLDEPSVGMNLEERTELADLVRAIRDRGTTVVVVDHNLDLVLGVADRVVVLDFGRVLAVGPPDQVYRRPAGAGRLHRPHRSGDRHRPDGGGAVTGILTVEGLQVRYGRVRALNGVDLAVEPGRVLAVLGRNGAGKSSLLGAVAGLVRPHRGTVSWDGLDISRAPADRRARSGIALVPEGRRIFENVTVSENLVLGGFAGPAADRDRALERVLAVFPILAERIDAGGGQLSGGQQQMLAIGRALMGEPRILLLDEPSLGLAPPGGRRRVCPAAAAQGRGDRDGPRRAAGGEGARPRRRCRGAQPRGGGLPRRPRPAPRRPAPRRCLPRHLKPPNLRLSPIGAIRDPLMYASTAVNRSNFRRLPIGAICQDLRFGVRRGHRHRGQPATAAASTAVDVVAMW